MIRSAMFVTSVATVFASFYTGICFSALVGVLTFLTGTAALLLVALIAELLP